MAENALYRFWDADDNLLYIGRTTDLPRRVYEHTHRDGKPMDLVVRIEAEHYPDIRALIEAEYRAIMAERPAWNVKPKDRPVGRKVQMRVTPELDDRLWDERRMWDGARPAPQDGRRTKQWYITDIVLEALRKFFEIKDVEDRMPPLEGEGPSTRPRPGTSGCSSRQPKTPSVAWVAPTTPSPTTTPTPSAHRPTPRPRRTAVAWQPL